MPTVTPTSNKRKGFNDVPDIFGEEGIVKRLRNRRIPQSSYTEGQEDEEEVIN